MIVDTYRQNYLVDPRAKSVLYNPTVSEMWTPVAGPLRPDQEKQLGSRLGITKNTHTGFVEPTHMNSAVFEDSYFNFINKGVAVNPTAPIHAEGGAAPLIYNRNASKENTPGFSQTKLSEDEKKRLRDKRKAASDASDVDGFAGPWASRETDEDSKKAQEITPAIQAHMEAMKEAKKQKNAARGKSADDDEIEPETSIFHGETLYDYQGRSYVSPPSSLKVNAAEDMKCYLPKQQIHTWSGHSKGVNRILFFPNTGHLLLSASMDKTMKIWSVGSGYKCLRTFNGHSEGIRDICFNSDGSRFMSCSYDRYIKLWDTETGQVISRHTSKKIPYCVKIHPEKDKENEVVVGQHDKLVVTWDVRANEIVQQYNEHLGPVNSVTFIDENRRFVSTSDDKKLFVWEYGIPVVVKHISEPDMHSMPYVAVHPSGKYFVGQSQDNQVLCFTAIGKYKLKRDKRFIGHLTAGYACEISFSPDGQFIMSGDAQGRVVFWDWKSQKVLKKLKAHDQVAIGAAWHPLETSKVATCSWDGTIKYWD